MKLKTTAVLALSGVLLSAAAAFAIPVGKPVLSDKPTSGDSPRWRDSSSSTSARMSAGDTLVVDARLGHASIARSSGGETYLFAQVSARDESPTGDKVGASSAVPMNLGIVIDRSGSMKGDRIANAMNAAVAAVERMRDGDSVTVVSFDTRADVVVPPTRVGADTRSSIEAAIRSIRLGGDTCISCGLEEGMKQLAFTSLGGDRINRMILLSDGATNAGIRDMTGLRSMAGRMHERGVSISTIGVDVDFDEKIMAAIASEANGRHYFVANASGLPAVFSQEFDDLLASVAKEAELTIELAPGVEAKELFDRSFRREGNKIIVPFGTFSAKQAKTVLLKLSVPTDREGAEPVADVKLTYRDVVKRTDGESKGSLALDVRGDGGEQKELDPFVAARIERSRTASTLTEANRLFESGRAGEARARLATRKAELAKTETSALAFAAKTPTAAPRGAAKGLDRDFEEQLGAVAQAERNFAPPPPRASGPAAGAPLATSPSSREGKASVRSNQQTASEFGF